jgi:hypothetical protein
MFWSHATCGQPGYVTETDVLNVPKYDECRDRVAEHRREGAGRAGVAGDRARGILEPSGDDDATAIAGSNADQRTFAERFLKSRGLAGRSASSDRTRSVTCRLSSKNSLPDPLGR